MYEKGIYRKYIESDQWLEFKFILDFVRIDYELLGRIFCFVKIFKDQVSNCLVCGFWNLGDTRTLSESADPNLDCAFDENARFYTSP